MITVIAKKEDTVIRIAFSEEEVTQLQDLSANHPHSFVRRKALALLLKSQDVAHHKIAKVIGVCENTVRAYFESYSREKIESVTTINFNKPESSLEQFEDVVRDYINKTPPTSIKQACHEIGAQTGVALKETQMRQYLKKLGVKFRKTAGVPAKANVAVQKEYVEKELQPRLKEAEEGKRKVYFMDAAHFVLGAFLGHLWSFMRIFIPTPSGRQRFNVLGALDAITKEMLTIKNTTYITSVQVCELLEAIAQKATDPITKIMIPVSIFLDNARYQRCKLVINKAKELGIELCFLPPYSPNLNLIERIWKFTKKQCLNSKYYASFLLFKTAISDFLTTMHSTHAAALNTLLTLKFQLFDDNQIKTAN
jgi:transposase